MITIESDRAASAIQSIAAEVLGYQVGVTQAGRLGNEITFRDLDPADVTALSDALSAGGHLVHVTVTGAGPGRPEIGPAFSVRFPPGLLARVDTAATALGVSRAEYLRGLAEKALGR